jgi:hypothetical protein
MMNIDESMEQLRRSLDERMDEIRRRNEEFMNRYSQPYDAAAREEKEEEELRFCEQCGAKVSANAMFCEQCGCRLDENLDEDTINTFADDDEEDDDISASSSSEPRTLRISFGGQRGHMIRQYDCGDENDVLYQRAQMVIDGELEASDFELELDDECRGYSDVFVQPIENNDYRTYLTVTDTDTDEIIFDDEIDVNTSLSGDPRFFDYSVLENEDEIKQKIEEMEDEMENCEEYDFDEECWENLLEDLKEVICESMCYGSKVYSQRRDILKEGESHRVFVYAPEIYGFSYECEIELEAGEEFDVKKLTFFMDDYDGVIPGDGNICVDSVTPFIKYGDKFYECYVDDWEEHYYYYYIADENDEVIWEM